MWNGLCIPMSAARSVRSRSRCLPPSAIVVIPSPSSDTVMPTHRNRKSRFRAVPGTGTDLNSARLGRGRAHGHPTRESAGSIDARRSRAAITSPSSRAGPFGEALIEVVDRDAHDATSRSTPPFTAWCTPRVIRGTRARGRRSTGARARGRSDHDPPAVAPQRFAERADGVVVATEAELAPADELPQVFLVVIAPPAFLDHLDAEPVGCVGVTHAAHDVGEAFLGPHRTVVSASACRRGARVPEAFRTEVLECPPVCRVDGRVLLLRCRRWHPARPARSV